VKNPVGIAYRKKAVTRDEKFPEGIPVGRNAVMQFCSSAVLRFCSSAVLQSPTRDSIPLRRGQGEDTGIPPPYPRQRGTLSSNSLTT